MKELAFDHSHNEVSGLLGVQQVALLEGLGMDRGFWIVGDEKAGHDAVALLGRLRDDGRWRVVPFTPWLAEGSSHKKTEDAETIARAGGWTYVFGSHYGKKRGPLAPARHFVSRFNESLLRLDPDEGRITGELLLVRRPFLLNRLINDALKAAKLPLFRASKALRKTHVLPALERGEEKDKKWRELVEADDVAINIEGATFLPGGHVLLGLRFPVSAKGHPILIEVEGIDRYFDKRLPPPRVVAVRVVENIGTSKVPAGIRELDFPGDALHLVTGNLDSKPEKSELIARVARSERAACQHWRVPLAQGSEAPPRLRGERLRTFPHGKAIEGIAFDHGRFWYGEDDERIQLSIAP